MLTSIPAKACGKAIVFNCGHKFHTSCLSQAGCQRQVFGQNTELWNCYICLKHQVFSEKKTLFSDDQENEIIVVTSEVDEEPPIELVNEITNQRVVQAHQYLSAMKRLRNNSEGVEASFKSIFDRDDFQLNLSCKPEEQ